ncbi:hypothetical protein EZH22_24560 [Xanthobacter dioxanivorans]|uniref:Lipoprotein n=1 Tax=Xanthobacter dioxanivorans TaxID=2528964 RepID=A0A974PMV9_9HYPH|nr:hypothetical protein [Xanthobacter dioxanivorans]QRG06124.1 hypothetical protein EZH22_24560 [Xanthobacter dioxanivorans]
MKFDIFPAALILVAALAGCASTPRNDGPSATWTLPIPVDTAVACVITGLNSKFPADFNRPYPITHSAATTAPGSVYEITMQQTITTPGNELYFVRVMAAGTSSKVEAFALPAFRADVISGVDRCADTLKR